MRRSFVAILAASLCSLAAAQDYPAKPIRIIVPLTPGSGADIAGRIVAKVLGDQWKQPVIVENRPGAGGIIGTQAVVKADPDGYTLLVQSSSHAANPAIYKSLPYDSLKDIVDVAILGKTPYVMVAQANGPYRSVRQIIDAAKAKPGDVPFASAGIGSSSHLVAEYAISIAGVKMLHIPFKGSPDAIADVIGGRTSFYMAPINTAVNLIKDGKLAALGVSTRGRVDVLPDAPPLMEQGLPGYEISLWFGMWAPASTPPAVVQKLNAQVNGAMQVPEVREHFAKLGISPSPMKVDEFAKFVRSEIDTYRVVVKQANIQPQ